jgi:hypothetical protein
LSRVHFFPAFQQMRMQHSEASLSSKLHKKMFRYSPLREIRMRPRDGAPSRRDVRRAACCVFNAWKFWGVKFPSIIPKERNGISVLKCPTGSSHRPSQSDENLQVEDIKRHIRFSIRVVWIAPLYLVTVITLTGHPVQPVYPATCLLIEFTNNFRHKVDAIQCNGLGPNEL